MEIVISAERECVTNKQVCGAVILALVKNVELDREEIYKVVRVCVDEKLPYRKKIETALKEIVEVDYSNYLKEVRKVEKIFRSKVAIEVIRANADYKKRIEKTMKKRKLAY